MPLVMELVQNTIAANRTSQKFILLEGLCNSNKLESDQQRLELRFMDEFFAIQQNIGEVCAIMNLTAEGEQLEFNKEEQVEEAVVEEEVKDDKPADGGDDGAGVDDDDDDDET